MYSSTYFWRSSTTHVFSTQAGGTWLRNMTEPRSYPTRTEASAADISSVHFSCPCSCTLSLVFIDSRRSDGRTHDYVRTSHKVSTCRTHSSHN